ncbi:hypothetical protein GOP47_0006332 [Adiantum capillus-veneris]|uniref:V-SNARE coiled-coil homology domain-containing protein n=1 Tax=Adiantum capillus-veneris TaxID=13818 RepID=A0A9D4V2P0_ADICA|nr:hypothetical protein GOP47_0006332 [Adiantum capillus-veneris]
MEDCEQDRSQETTINVAHLQKKVTEVTDIMKKNIDETMNRGANIAKVYDHAKSLGVQAESYNRTAKDLKWKLWLKNMKFKLCLLVAILIVLALVIWLSICKGFQCT